MHVFSHTSKIDPKINIYTKRNMIMYKLIVEQVCNSVTTLWNSEKERKEKENDRATVISHTTRCEVEDIKMCIERC
jgi:hypothetical protein